MLDGQVLGASQAEEKPFGKPPLQREYCCRVEASQKAGQGGPLRSDDADHTAFFVLVGLTGYPRARMLGRRPCKLTTVPARKNVGA